jgi:hypothetical protein
LAVVVVRLGSALLVTRAAQVAEIAHLLAQPLAVRQLQDRVILAVLVLHQAEKTTQVVAGVEQVRRVEQVQVLLEERVVMVQRGLMESLVQGAVEQQVALAAQQVQVALVRVELKAGRFQLTVLSIAVQVVVVHTTTHKTTAVLAVAEEL